MKIEAALLTNQGGRERNEDFADYYVTETGGCWIVADGLGGHKGGEEASKTVVQTTIEAFQKDSFISCDHVSNYIIKSHNKLYHLQKEHKSPSAFRTTIAILTIHKNKAIWGHIGDSRLYHFQNNTIISQTKDHSLCQTLVNIGELKQEDIRFHEDRSRLLQALGMEKQLKPTITGEPIHVQNNDAFLLCTDGFWEYVTEVEMETTLLKVKTPQQWLTLMQDILLTRVPNKHDNYTAVGLFIGGRGDKHVRV
jgi:PPM family protein phosphatase